MMMSAVMAGSGFVDLELAAVVAARVGAVSERQRGACCEGRHQGDKGDHVYMIGTNRQRR